MNALHVRLRRSGACCCVVGALLAGGCAVGAGSTPPAGGPVPELRLASTPGANPIKHIVIVVQENRSFDNIFDGYPGADSKASGIDSKGDTVPLHQVQFVENEEDMYHDWNAAIKSWDGNKMDGFDTNIFSGGKKVGSFPYAYLERSQVAPYWDMARQYVLADHMFPTMFGGSFTGHLDLIAGTADLSPTVSETDFPTAHPWGCDAPAGTTTSELSEKRVVTPNGPFPCFTQFSTMADTLDAAKVSWKYYAPSVTGSDGGGQVWTEFDAIKNVRYGPDWNTNFPLPTQVLADAASGDLPTVSWVIPDWLDSDHAGAHSDQGPSWVAAVVNAIGKGPDWKSTAIVIVWDDWGGWYDDLPPPQLDFRGLGIRVPCLIVSPYAKKGYVSHTQYEFSSILKFVEQTFDVPVVGSPANGYTDTRAANILDAFDFTQKPRAFKAIPAKYPPSHFVNAKPSGRAPDDD